MKLVLGATAALAALISTGSAQAQARDWTGAYVSAHAGWGWGGKNSGESILFDTNLDGSFSDRVNTATGANAFSPGFCNGAANTALPAGGCARDDDGFEFGARAGYDWQVGPMVVGALVELSRTNVEDAVSAYSTTPAFYTMDRSLKMVGAIRARVGYALEDTLVYATGGVARGEIDHRFSTSNTANTFRQTDDDKASGFQLGGGAEHRITPDVSIGVEYIYTKLDDDNFTVRSAGPAAANNPFLLVNANGTDFRRSQEDFKVHSVRMTASYRF